MWANLCRSQSRFAKSVVFRSNSVLQQREAALGRVFIAGFPNLIASPLIYTNKNGEFVESRLRMKFASIAKFCKGFALPTFEKNMQQFTALLALERDTHCFIGVRGDVNSVEEQIDAVLQNLSNRCGARVPRDMVLRANCVSGFHVSLHASSRHDLVSGLETILGMDLPIMLSIAADQLVPLQYADLCQLACTNPNLLAIVDHGADGIACEHAVMHHSAIASTTSAVGNGPDGVFLLRGTDGDYAVWLRENNGPYDGICSHAVWLFAEQFFAMKSALTQAVKPDVSDSVRQLSIRHATDISQNITRVMNGALALVSDTALHGDAVEVSLHLLDHHLAYGQRAVDIPLTVLGQTHVDDQGECVVIRESVTLPASMVQAAGLVMKDLAPTIGYVSKQ